jgi:tetratricopeptide (TPR) repeat protein
MALEKIIGGILGLVAGVALASQVNAQTIEYVTDSTGNTQMIINHGTVSENINTGKINSKTNSNPSIIYDGKNEYIQQDAGNIRYIIDSKTGKILQEFQIIKYNKNSLEDKVIKTPVPKEKPKSTYELGNDAFAKGDYQTAMNKYQDILQKTKNTSLKVDLLYQIGLCYDNLNASGSGSNGKAQMNYEKATQIGEQLLSQGKYDPKKLAQIYAQWARTDNLNLYIKNMKRAIELNPTKKSYKENYGSVVNK